MKRGSCSDGGECAAKKPAQCEAAEDGVLQLRGVYAWRKGERDDMQDEHVICDDFGAHFDASQCDQLRRAAYYAVFDGHGGARAAKHAAKHWHAHFARLLPRGGNLATLERAMKRCLVDAYRQTDEQFLSEAAKVYVKPSRVLHSVLLLSPAWRDGCTATTLVVLNNSLYVANLGDSKAILCRCKAETGEQVALTLTKDHSPHIFDERDRIQKAGGVVRDGRIMGQLEVSRSLGDGPFKKHGVTCIPDVKKCSLTERDRYVLMACDGLWKVFSGTEAIEYVDGAWKRDVAREGDGRDDVWQRVCNQLVAEAVRRGSGDNVTVVLVAISPSV